MRLSLPRSSRFLRRSLARVIHLVTFLIVLGHGDIGESVRNLKLLETSSDVEELFEAEGTVLISVDLSKDVANSLVVRLESESSHRLAEIVGTDLSIVVGIEFSESLLESSKFVGIEDGTREVYENDIENRSARVTSHAREGRVRTVIVGREVNLVSTSSNVFEGQFTQSSLTQTH